MLKQLRQYRPSSNFHAALGLVTMRVTDGEAFFPVRRYQPLYFDSRVIDISTAIAS